jgi:hypothetical protein
MENAAHRASIRCVGGAKQPATEAVDIKTLHAKIGQLSLENDFLEGALIKAGMLSAKPRHAQSVSAIWH